MFRGPIDIGGLLVPEPEMELKPIFRDGRKQLGLICQNEADRLGVPHPTIRKGKLASLLHKILGISKTKGG